MISALRLMLLFLMVALAGQVLGVGALQVEIYDYDAAIKSNVEAEILSDRQKYTYDGTLILSNDIGIAKNFRAPNLQNRYFIAFIDDFSATKSVKPSLSTLHTRGTKIPGGRKIGDTLAGSNKIKNSNGDTFKRVDFAPSKPHNGLSPHTHPNFRNQLPDGTIRLGVSRNAGTVTRRDIIDAARQGSQRNGGL